MHIPSTSPQQAQASSCQATFCKSVISSMTMGRIIPVIAMDPKSLNKRLNSEPCSPTPTCGLKGYRGGGAVCLCDADDAHCTKLQSFASGRQGRKFIGEHSRTQGRQVVKVQPFSGALHSRCRTHVGSVLM